MHLHTAWKHLLIVKCGTNEDDCERHADKAAEKHLFHVSLQQHLVVIVKDCKVLHSIANLNLVFEYKCDHLLSINICIAVHLWQQKLKLPLQSVIQAFLLPGILWEISCVEWSDCSLRTRIAQGFLFNGETHPRPRNICYEINLHLSNNNTCLLRSNVLIDWIAK